MTIPKDNLCPYVAERKQVLLKKLKKKDTGDIQIMSISAALRELDMIMSKFCEDDKK